jgi:hypothetical protein
MSLTMGEIITMLAAVIVLGGVAYANRHLFGVGSKLHGVSTMELVYFVIGIPGAVLGYYYNFQYFHFYGADAGWVHFTQRLFDNPAAASVSTDLIVANLLFIPIWTVVDGRRHSMRATWLYFPLSLLVSVSFTMGVYLALRERQMRWRAAA